MKPEMQRIRGYFERISSPPQQQEREKEKEGEPKGGREKGKISKPGNAGRNNGKGKRMRK